MLHGKRRTYNNITHYKVLHLKNKCECLQYLSDLLDEFSEFIGLQPEGEKYIRFLSLSFTSENKIYLNKHSESIFEFNCICMFLYPPTHPLPPPPSFSSNVIVFAIQVSKTFGQRILRN